MTAPLRTPNPGTVEQPERSSRRVVRKSPLGWLPWALLGALALLLGLVLLAYNAVDDDGPEGPAGDSLGQVSDDDGDSAAGSDGKEGADRKAVEALSGKALVGGAGLGADVAAQIPGAEALAEQPGTAGTVLFPLGSAELDEGAREVVASAAASLRDARVQRVSVVGHTDVVAGDPTNDPLSQQRADAVAAALRALLPDLQVETVGRGQEEPVADNATEGGRQLNRRAVISAAA